MATIELRPKQTQAIDLIRQTFGEVRCVLLEAPTGFGKTITFCYIASRAMLLGNRIIIVAHRQELIDQISRALAAFGVEHGIIDPRYSPNYRRQVQVASIGTLLARLKKGKIPAAYAKFSLMILDECHHLLPENTFGKAYGLLGRPRLLGVTATPQRGATGRGLGVEAGGLFERLVQVTTVHELIEDGWLSDFAIYAPPQELDLSDVKVVAGDFEKKSLAEKVNRPKVTGDAVREYTRVCPGVPAVAFCVSLDHCRNVAAEFQAAGYNFQVIDGSMPDERRKALTQGLGNGIQGLVSCDVISEGFDLPAITCPIFLRPTKSLGLFLQQAGRALRAVYAEGFDLSTREGRLAAIAAGPKPRAIFLDHAGLTYVHGMVDDPREWSLAGRPKRKGKPKDVDQRLRFSQCPKCYTIHEKAPQCPSCGHVYEVASRQVVQQDGDLHEITREEREARRQEKNRALGRCKTVPEMIAAGASPGEAHHRFKARQEKQALIDGIVADLKLWYQETGQPVPDVFGVKTYEVERMKPAALRDLRTKVDDHFAVWRSVAPQQTQETMDF